jgi:hypothetical protein
MIDAGIFKPADAEYLERAQRVVPPVRNLKLPMPKGRRDRYPDDPEKVVELASRYGLDSTFQRLLKALGTMAAPAARVTKR